jgi:signal transduction histidine kinase
MVASVVRTSRQAGELQQEVGRRELAERRLIASERNHAIGQLVGGVAHDFNNLLTAVIANLEIILRLTTQGDVRRSAENAQHAAFRGARLTQSLLAFSRRQPLRNESVVANELVARCHVLLQRAAGENIRVELHPSIAAWTCRADPAQLETALLNLIANSRDAMPSGGRIVITTRNSVHRSDGTADGRAELSPGDYVEIAVTDTGQGIAPELRDRVFEPFFTTKDSFGGAGLGLSQVQGFARQLGGDVLIDSTLGEGTRVRMLLPRAHEERPIGEFVRAF